MSSFFENVLIIERDNFFLDVLHRDGALKDHMMISKTTREGLNLLKKPQNRIRAVFISLSFTQVEINEFVNQYHALELEIPLIAISHNTRTSMSGAKLQDFGFTAQLEQPKDMEPLVKQLKKLFPDKHKWDGIEASQEAKESELELSDQDFLPIATKDFLQTDKCFFNVFVRLNANKFVKILNAGDPFDRDFAEKYNAQKFESLWVKKTEHQQYTHLSEKNAASGLKRQSADAGRRIAHLGDNVSQALTRVGLSDDNLLYADRFLEHSVSFLRQQRLEGNGFGKILNELADSEHCAAVSVIAGLLASHLGFESTKAVKVVGLAALLHDVAIYKDRKEFPAEIPYLLDGADLDLFNSHARDGAKILTELGIFDEVVIQAVAQHHDKKSNLGGHATNLVGEIVSASDLFCHQVVQSDNPQLDRFIDRQLKEYRPQIEIAFRAIFKKKAARKAV